MRDRYTLGRDVGPRSFNTQLYNRSSGHEPIARVKIVNIRTLLRCARDAPLLSRMYAYTGFVKSGQVLMDNRHKLHWDDRYTGHHHAVRISALIFEPQMSLAI